MKRTEVLIAVVLAVMMLWVVPVRCQETEEPSEEATAESMAKLFFEKEPATVPGGVPTALRIRVLRGVEDESGELVWKAVNPQKTVFHPGDRFKFEVTSLRNGYLNMYNVDANGQKVLLLPHKEISGGKNFLKARKTYIIPPASAQGYYRVMSEDEMAKAQGKETVDFYVVGKKPAGRSEEAAAEAAGAKMVFVKDPDEKEGQVSDGTFVGNQGDYLHYRLVLRVQK
jgi:hypothetical protein